MELKLVLSLLIGFALNFSANGKSNSTSEAVRDVDGRVVEAGIRYLMVPAVKGKGGGLSMYPGRDNASCFSDVIQYNSNIYKGLPVVFFPADKDKIVRLSTDLNIMFSIIYTLAENGCVSSYVWQLGPFDGVTNKYFITTGGAEGNPGPTTVRNWFKIKKQEKDYSIYFCPSVCIFCKIFCEDVGVYVDDNVKRLALSDTNTPLKVRFKRVGLAL